MAEQKQEYTRTTIALNIGTVANPVVVTKASTGKAGIKAGKSKGTVYMEVQLTKSQVDEINELPDIKAMTEAKMKELDVANAQLNNQIAQPNLPESVKANLTAQLGVIVDWATPIYDEQYQPVTNEAGEPLYTVKLKQQSIQKQLDSGTTLDNIIYVTHYVKDATTGKMQRKIENGKPMAYVVKSGAEVIVKVNTKMTKYPNDNKWTLTMNRLVAVYQLVEGEFESSATKAINDDALAGMDFGDDDEVETTSKEDNSDTNVPTENSNDGTTPPADENPYA